MPDLEKHVALTAELSEVALGVVNIVLPGSATTVALASTAVRALTPLVLKAYAALMQARPAEVSEAEWLELLAHPALNKTAADYLDGALNPTEP